MTRRGVLAIAGAGGLALATRSFAAKPSFAVPQVDRLTLQVVDDAATFGPFLENLDLPGLKVMRAGNGGQPNIPRMLPRAVVGEFGLSILGDSAIGTSKRRVLIDFGYSRETLLTNMQLLGIDPTTIDAAVLSHGHLDHYGGFTGVFGEAVSNARRVPLFVGGEEAFCERVAMIGNPPPIMGTLDRMALSRAGFDVTIRPDAAVVADQAFTTGIIPLESFERSAIPTRMRPGIGCDRASLNAAKRSATELPDDAEHELATCYAVKGLGLVVIASCSHRGVINSVLRAQAISGIKKVHAVLGGFHLVRPRTEEEARRTVAEFALIDPTYIVPMHCTGEVFIAEALRVMPQKVVRSYVGSKFVFSEDA
ncbi:MBL fold metallo-hydrolase [Sphingorhabdus sp. IMCC26285]|uniref:MBL fold metallo-hydrolase n=1 Tax=Sphingorhabdus profundilacus TaxID=2509718 RepID=A0A6I4LV25_9SPHN|nr:MBL fold metallo-hydrolase [Sphingorhabdus profundilacus]MVZ96669.1 MBL fold metallo-hydrolase [Sphingorhabdus profundilacus]